MADAARRFRVPVTGGNVSFYNESPRGAVYPTPVIGMVGILDDMETRIPSFFQEEGDLIFLLGETANELGGSAYLDALHGLRRGLPPRLDLEKEARLQSFFLEAAKARILRSAHDLSEGGLAVALAECCFGRCPTGARISNLEICEPRLRKDALLFGETQSRVLVSSAPDQKEAVIRLAQKHGVPVFQIGKVSGDAIVIEDLIELKTAEALSIWKNAVPRRVR